MVNKHYVQFSPEELANAAQLANKSKEYGWKRGMFKQMHERRLEIEKKTIEEN